MILSRRSRQSSANPERLQALELFQELEIFTDSIVLPSKGSRAIFLEAIIDAEICRTIGTHFNEFYLVWRTKHDLLTFTYRRMVTVTVYLSDGSNTFQHFYFDTDDTIG